MAAKPPKSKLAETFKNVSVVWWVLGAAILSPLVYVLYRIITSDHQLLSLTIIPLLGGVIYENNKLGTPWKTTAIKLTGALVLSLVAFLPGKRESPYVFENHIIIWPYIIIGLYALFSAVYHDEKVVPKLTEGITLLQSIAIGYWILDVGLLTNRSVFNWIVVLIALVLIGYSMLHAFTKMKLTPRRRLVLSLWSSLIMIVFAIEHIYRLYQFDRLESYELSGQLLITLQYFLLGIALIYMVQNYTMLVEYLPDKQRFYGKDHMRDIQKMNKTHIKRYSPIQVSRGQAFIALVFLGTVYFANYKFQYLDRSTMIWLSFWLFPLGLSITATVEKLTTHNTSD